MHFPAHLAQPSLACLQEIRQRNAHVGCSGCTDMGKEPLVCLHKPEPCSLAQNSEERLLFRNGEPSISWMPGGQPSFKSTPGPVASFPEVWFLFFSTLRLQKPSQVSLSCVSLCLLCSASDANVDTLSAWARPCHETKGIGACASKCVLLLVSAGVGPARGKPELFTC